MTLVLVVDDVRAVAEGYAYDLQRLGGYETRVAPGGREALEALSGDPVDCVILDLEMPGMDGFAVLEEMEKRGLDVPVIVYTGTGDYDRCARAIRLGAYSFIDKEQPIERVVRDVENAVERRRLADEVDALKERLDDETRLIGQSPPMHELRAAIARLAPIPSPVLIVGASGTGKELVARALHAQSPGAGEPFLPVNCAALPENLVESELFGHERGAFTGANRLRKGAFESAGSGTLFLDEVGELPAAAQAKLLRVLEARELTRVGGTRTVSVHARVIAATHRNLEQDVEDGRFRQDLYYRLNVHTLPVPALSQRLSDIPDLVDHLLKRTCARYGIKPKTIEPDALQRLMSYDWHRNNVRELRNVVERMVIASPHDSIALSHVPPELGSSPTLPAPETGKTFQEQKAEAERQIVLAALHRNDWHITNTAKELGLADHSSLIKIMRRIGIGDR